MHTFGAGGIEGTRVFAVTAAHDDGLGIACRNGLAAGTAAGQAEQRDDRQHNERNCAQVHALIFPQGGPA